MKVMCLYNVKKGVDKPKGVCYTVQAVSERHAKPPEKRAVLRDQSCGANLENDTEKDERNLFKSCEDGPEREQRPGAVRERRAGERPANSQIRRVKHREGSGNGSFGERPGESVRRNCEAA